MNSEARAMAVLERAARYGITLTDEERALEFAITKASDAVLVAPNSEKNAALSKFLVLLKQRSPHFIARYIAGEASYLDAAEPARRPSSGEFYLSRAWLGLRYEALRKYGNRCQACGAGKLDGAVLQVDHIKPRSRYPDLELDPDNVQVLCKDCNHGKSNIDSTDWRPSA